MSKAVELEPVIIMGWVWPITVMGGIGYGVGGVSVSQGEYVFYLTCNNPIVLPCPLACVGPI